MDRQQAAEPKPGAPLEEAFFDTSPEADTKAVRGSLWTLWQHLRVAVPIALAAGSLFAAIVWVWAGPRSASRADAPALVAAARKQGAALGRELGAAAPGPLRAAVGHHSITPDPPNHVRLGGYGGVRKSVGLDGDLRAFSFLVQAGVGPPCAVLGADILMVTPELAAEVSAEVLALASIPRDRMIFTASHTHSSVGNYGRTMAETLTLGASEPGVYFLSWRWAPAVWGAAEWMRPATLRVAQPVAPLLIRNRADPSGTVDPVVDVLQLDVDGLEPAVLVLFGAHPTSETRRDWMSADYPGFMRQEVSSHVGAYVAFAGGALGSMSVQSPTGQRTPSAIGKMLATPVMAAVRPRPRSQDVPSAQARVACGRAPLPLPQLRVPVHGNLALTPAASNRLLDGPPVFHVSALLAGPLVLLSFPGELSGEVTPALRARARARGYDLAVASFSGEYAGYLLPAERYGRGPEAHLQFAGVGAAAPAVAFAEGLLDALPRGPLPPDARTDRVWPP